jgi:hypothetical protein
VTRRTLRIAASLAGLMGIMGCGARMHGAVARGDAGGALATRSTGSGRPTLAVVAREGDARGALAIAVTTAGIAPERGALPAVALAALVQERLAAHGVDATAVGGWDGWRLRVLVESAADMARVIEAVRTALLDPVVADEPALAVVARKAAALARRPLPNPAYADVAACTGEAYAAGEATAPAAAELEGWRRAAHGLGRLAIATVGDATLADAAVQTLARAPSWPRGAAVPPSPWPAPNAPSVVFGASGDLDPGAARILITARTHLPELAVAVAPALGDPRGPLASRLAALEAPARVRSVVATAHVDGGCLATAIDLSARDLLSNAPARIATAAALARQELAVEIADATSPPDLGTALTERASDPRDAAERAAWWSLAGPRAGATVAPRGAQAEDAPRIALAVELAPLRDAPASTASTGGVEAIRQEIDRATLAWHMPVVEARTFVERGQGEAWVLLASPCGTGLESNGDAGIGAAVAMTAAAQASAEARDAQIEPFVSVDGVGVLVHGPARPGESPQAHARRLADTTARAFAADELQPARIAAARIALLTRATATDERTLGSLASALAPGHPSWLAPQGTLFGLSSISDESVAVRASSVRAGPLRVAVVANVDLDQGEAAVRAVDRWVARRPGESRSCPATATAGSPRAGTYAVELPTGALSEVVLGIPLPVDPAARAAARWIAAALDGADGLLGRVLGAGSGSEDASFAHTWSASVLDAPQSVSLVVRLVGPDASMDSAVAQVRGLLDRLRHGALREDDRARAAAAIARARLAASLDPRARVIALWRGDSPSPAPSLEDLRSFAASSLRDEALVIVAARPPHLPTEKTATH